MTNFRVVPISRGLRADLSKWLKWAEHGAPQGKPFNRSLGLCFNLSDHFDELTQVFQDQGLSVSWPFGIDTYYLRKLGYSQHQDLNRLNWVRFMIANCPVKEKNND